MVVMTITITSDIAYVTFKPATHQTDIKELPAMKTSDEDRLLHRLN